MRGRRDGEAELAFGCGASEFEEPQRGDVRLAAGHHSLESGAEVQAENKKQFLKGKRRQATGERG